LIDRQNRQLMIGWPTGKVRGITRIRNQITLDLIIMIITIIIII
jgi:hypothetical protein